MAGKKVERTVRVNEEHVDRLDAMTEKYALGDAQNALRIVPDYGIEEGVKDHIFKTVRCGR